MSGFGRGGGKGGHGRGSGGAGGIAALRRGMPPKKSQQQQQLSKSAGAAPRNDSSSSASALEESFQLVCAPQGSSQFAMMIRLTPGLLDELRRAEAEGAASSIKFASHPSGGHLLKVGHEEYKFSSAPEPGELCDVFEEQKAGEDGQGVLASVGSVWRKIAVQRTLSASEKDRVKKRSVEAEQQLKSRKAILVDSSLMKAETAAPGDAAARRPPIKGKKEPPPKKRKVTPAVPSKEKNGPLLTAEPAVPPAARSPPLAATASAPPHSLPSVEKRALVEEITIGSASPAKAVPKEKEKEKEKEKTSAATTPEVHVKTTTSAGGAAGGTVNMTELRNTIIALLTETPRGMKAIEKSLSEVMPQPDRRNIEKILKSIALYKAPGKYELKPGVQPESYTGPSPGSGSLPDATAVDSPESPAGAAESKADEFAKLPAAGVEVERIDIGEEDESPAKSPVLLEHKTNAIQEKDEEEGEVQPGGTPGDDANITVEPLEEPNPPKAAASSGSSSTSGSDSDSDSESDSSSGSGSSGSSGSESSSSSDEEDENVDIVSDDDNHKPKAKAEKRSHKSKPASARPGSERKTPDELHRDKDSEDIDIVDADDSSKLNSIVERITETIPLEVDIIPCDGDSPEEALEVKSDVPELPAPTQSQSRPREDEKREKPVEPPVSKALEQNSRERASSRAHTDKKLEPHTRDTTFEAAEARSSGPEAYPRTSSGPEAHPKHSGPETHPRPSGPPAKVDGRSKVSVRKSKHQPKDNEPRKELDTGARVEADRNEPRKEFDTGARVEADRNEPRKEFDTGGRIEADRKEFDTGARVEADRIHSDPVPGGTSKDTDFFVPYEKAVSEVRGPIRSHEQYMEYCREYREKYPVYIQLNSCLEGDRGSFERLQRDIDIAKSANDKTRLAAIYQKVKQDYMHCRKRFKRMSKTFLLLHDELRTLKDRCKEYARQAL